MGRYLQPGHTYQDGQTISGPSLTEHVADAILKTTAISDQALKSPADVTDELLINSGGTFNKITLDILKELIAETLTSADFSSELQNELKTPVGAIMDFAGTAEPDGWLFCYGQQVSRLTYDDLFTAIGTTYGVGNGSTTFNLPDCRGRVVAGQDNMGGASANRLTSIISSNTLGAAGGSQSHSLTIAELASHTHSFNDYYQTTSVINPGYLQGGIHGALAETGATTPNGTAAAGSGSAHPNVQPTIILNKIIRAL